MPNLNFVGKSKVVNHHREVSFRFLEKQYGSSENMIIHGDNLLALRSLLATHRGKIKCIYIDPPYNTGNEGWIYNDNVNDPEIKTWIGKVVGDEETDLNRHDKWLCMMYPRLRLLHELLSDDGVIFISIDDNEQANLKLICDEIFGRINFVGAIPWRKRTAKSDVPHGISQDFEYVMCYAKKDFQAGRRIDRKYFESDDFPGRPWRTATLTKQTTAAERPNSFFTLINPKNGDEYPANPNRTWCITKETFQQYYDQDKIIFPGDYDFLKISKPVMRYWKSDDEKKAGINFGLTAASTYLPPEVGMTQNGTKEIMEIFGEKAFNFPKPSTLIRHLIEIATVTSPDAIILDAFAGSGTTAQAVIELNREDSGNRKFILIESMDYAESITAERVRRVGGEFSFYELGDPIFVDGEINPDLSRDLFRRYLYFSETKKEIPPMNPDEPTLLGIHDGIAYHLFDSVLDFNSLNQIKTRSNGYIIFAESCIISQETRDQFKIIFRKIPRDIRKI